MKLEELNEMFDMAVEQNNKWICVIIKFDNGEKEYIFNRKENFEDKKKYYNLTYDENLKHRYSPVVSIMGAVIGNSMATIEKIIEENSF